ncbi:uncharacterized protein TRIREDRAFT_64916 [Trichoderma reesei QM6a]|uniref:Predicted protein n=2 Tax=Hypocrea jecorina TaxID=51453 RepID=G0RP92_HYPJQ|nr:uncharacterized protein TRIREDRAFT_64916 [Trichoderma reesei QM6a]EGR47070.1 predicted protein [Trichoderma reesei QM6a]ETR99771.1 hypothetical protein M419DRAFT_132279 [Trichoderma reesei RUT C-30]
MAATDQSSEPASLLAGSEPEIIEAYDEQVPTASHALAEESIQADDQAASKGASQLGHDDVEVKNIGWNQKAQSVPQPVVGGLRNEELWTLIRRFNQQVFEVRSIDTVPLADLDMNVAEDDVFSPDKLRATLERFYMTVVVSLFSLWKHIVRLRSWRESKRTASFLAVYSLAWLLDLVVPTVIVFFMVLIAYPPARTFCFPPVPPSIVDSKTGGAQKPPAGVLASDSSVTGAPEKHEGEGVEQEAHSFVNSIASVIISTSAGKNPQQDPHDDNTAPDPTNLTTDIAEAKDATDGKPTDAVHDKTKTPVANMVWTKTGPVMHMLSDFVDTWERFGNALSPTPPFPVERPRLTLAACLVPPLLLSFYVTSYMLLKGIGFGFGFVLFGDPIITPALQFINRTYPRWEKFTELRNTILRGIPTNAQLAITLLRIGERNKTPIPPPPSSDVPPPPEVDPEAAQQVDALGVSDHEAREALQPDLHNAQTEIKDDDNQQRKPKRSHRILHLLKGTTKGGVHTALTADKAKAAVGATHARNRLGAVDKRSDDDYMAGPVCFPARYGGKKGHAFITATATSPALSWTSDIEDVNPAWTVAIEDIAQLRKVGGLGWKSKILVGWAMGREVVDGLVVRTKDGKEYHLTAITMRDELFNRLIAMGHQMWEAC